MPEVDRIDELDRHLSAQLSEIFAGWQSRFDGLRESVGKQGESFRETLSRELRVLRQDITDLKTSQAVGEARDNGRKELAAALHAIASGLKEVGKLGGEVKLHSERIATLSKMLYAIWGVIILGALKMVIDAVRAGPIP